ncbi:MAG: 2-phosphosulfolactate phosphatase [Pirellulales bacterium]
MHDRYLRVHYLPSHAAAEELAGSAVVVIDALRATSVICQALAAGAPEVVPFLEVEEAIAAWTKEHREQVVLGGERGGMQIDGFDLGNSPSEYTPQAVGGRRVFITTTNGTRALHHAQQALRVIVGSFLNLSAVVTSLKDEPRVDILCAGTGGCATGEDILAAGAMVDRLCSLPGANWRLNDAASAARHEWSGLVAAADDDGRSVSEQLAMEMRETAGGHNLVEIGLDQDLVDCAQIDRLNIVPELDVRAWRITAG